MSIGGYHASQRVRAARSVYRALRQHIEDDVECRGRVGAASVVLDSQCPICRELSDAIEALTADPQAAQFDAAPVSDRSVDREGQRRILVESRAALRGGS